MNFADIKLNDIANGPGVRVSLFVSGCTNHCDGCFNKDTWDFHYGKPFTEEDKDFIINNLAQPRYKGITILGGEPFELQNQPEVLELIKQIRKELPNKTIWVYTGFTFDKDLCPGGKRYMENITPQILQNIDVLVDGKFDKTKYSIELLFRGSSNQRLIDMKTSNYDNIILFDPSERSDLI